MSRMQGRIRAFSLVELVVVIVIIGILAAIAIPRLSRGSSGAAEAALSANLATIRAAINLYSAEHNGAFPGPDADGFKDALTLYSDAKGNTNAGKTAVFKYGPYLVSIPPCPVGNAAGTADAAVVIIDDANSPPKPDAAKDAGWVYNTKTGQIVPNTEDKDEQGIAYTEY
jgi:prepilin-type N-terminal cleavage/methylation domain-containing protein